MLEDTTNQIQSDTNRDNNASGIDSRSDEEVVIDA